MNKILQSSILSYKKFGFREVSLEVGIYQRVDIKMEKIIY